MKNLILVMGIIILSGCATKPISTEQAKEVPAQRLIDPSFTTNRDGSGQVIIKRDGGLRGSLCSVRVFADSKPIADLESGEKVTLFLNPGDHVFGAQGTGACYGGLTAQFGKVSEGKTISYRIGLGSVGDFAIYPD
ncbi:hypothetical protein [Enterobacter hormaechei]|uniref:hypothetical protein n=1 Tax=Enterobacter hormaechei TaxID=158836 RepID=UPI0020764868|nr:hypothetical protein [Enterobacter hormaechei]HAV1656000.1 hypothetical protein [Enterobacter hormaechei subsp. steigerwaltii]HCT9253696.1 hypothetical protein [Enterobacter hormaechei]